MKSLFVIKVKAHRAGILIVQNHLFIVCDIFEHVRFCMANLNCFLSEDQHIILGLGCLLVLIKF